MQEGLGEFWQSSIKKKKEIFKNALEIILPYPVPHQVLCKQSISVHHHCTEFYRQTHSNCAPPWWTQWL
jgi:hypothetical protein